MPERSRLEDMSIKPLRNLDKNGVPGCSQTEHQYNLLQSFRPLMLLVSLALPSVTLAQEIQPEKDAFDITLSLGVISAPVFLGADDYQTSMLPNLTLNYRDRWSASLRSIKYTAISKESWTAGPVLSYDFGRDERPDDGPFAISSNTTIDLVGVGDIDGTLQLGVFLEYEARSYIAKLELHQGVDGGHDGVFGETSISYRGQFTAVYRQAFYSIGPVLSFGNDGYYSTFFDISASQSAASGLSQFDANGGISSFGLHTSIIVPLAQKISLIGFAQYDQLAGDVADSSIVTERGSEEQLAAGILVNYRF